MKNLNVILAVVAGAVAGASVGLLLAPKKGADTREDICNFLKEKGIVLKKDKLDALVEKIADGIKK